MSILKRGKKHLYLKIYLLLEGIGLLKLCLAGNSCTVGRCHVRSKGSSSWKIQNDHGGCFNMPYAIYIKHACPALDKIV